MCGAVSGLGVEVRRPLGALGAKPGPSARLSGATPRPTWSPHEGLGKVGGSTLPTA